MECTTLIHGDCLAAMRGLKDNGVVVDALITDPPYGMTSCKWDCDISLDQFWGCVKSLRRDDSANMVVFSKQPFTTMVNYSNISEFKYELIWRKQQATNPMCAKMRVMPIHENISVFYGRPGTYNPQMRMGFSKYSRFNAKDDAVLGEVYGGVKSQHRDCSDGSRYPVSVLEFNNVRKAIHPTQKPEDLLEWLVRTYTNEGDVVLDPFMGSGSLGVVCMRLGRKYIGCELEQKYFDAASERIQGACQEIRIIEDVASTQGGCDQSAGCDTGITFINKETIDESERPPQGIEEEKRHGDGC